MRKRYLFGLVAATALCLPFAALANYEESYTNQAEFGKCYADPVYEQEFVGKTILGSRVRSVACMDGSKILTVLPAGTKIKVLAKTDGWYKVKTSNGTTGWVGSWLITKTSDTNLETKSTKVETPKSVPFGTVVSQMQTLSLSDLYKLRDKLAVVINEKEKKDALKKEETSKGTITLSGLEENSVVLLNWNLNGMSSPNGFKVVVSNEKNPVYPGNDYHYLSDSSVRSDQWDNLQSGTYYFRVCEYLGGKCGVYSNNLAITIK